VFNFQPESMTVLPAPRLVFNGQPRVQEQPRRRWAISVSRASYDQMVAVAVARDISVAELVRQAVAPVLDPNTPPEVIKDIVRRAQRREFDTFVEGRDKQTAGMRAAWASKDRPGSRESRRRRKNHCSRCGRTGHNAGRAACPP
jgi:hypothetical protein